MSLRTFVDSTGQEWHAFDVIPREQERRREDRRSSSEIVIDDAEGRREGDRRLSVGRAPRLATPAGGWLCFERGADRRRLSPIPADWSHCTDAQLEEYCRSARPVPQLPTSPRLARVEHSEH
ncbi:MAG TPA: hypothetical protein VN706_05255 [Gemmatimonadaceae bacterium]|nr:hypothetical protein [Gemmatimonadaceae bacterium]